MRLVGLYAALALAGGGGATTPAPTPKPSATATPGGDPRQIGTVSGFAVERTDFGTRVQLAADTLFDFDKATLTPAAQDNLRRAADLVRQGGAGTVTVTGHTDAKGDDAYNLALSSRRAEAVVAWLRAQPGLGTRAFTALGRGEAEPVAPDALPGGDDDAHGRARNRRVTLDIPR